jgi:TonB family protein
MTVRRFILLGLILVGQALLPGAIANAQGTGAAKRPLPQFSVQLEDLTYPGSAEKAGIQGRALVAFTINKRGRVDGPVIVSAEPAVPFADAALTAIKQVRFEVPSDWVASGGPTYQYQLSVLFKLSPCVAPACVAPKPHEGADDFLMITADAKR